MNYEFFDPDIERKQLDYSQIADNIDEKLLQELISVLQKPKPVENNYFARLICLSVSIGFLMWAPVTAVSSMICLYGILISSVAKASQAMQLLWYPLALLFIATSLTQELALPLLMVFLQLTYLVSK